MKIKGTEKQYLFGSKLREGKTYDEAGYEIERDNYYINNSKGLLRDLRNKIKELTKENDRLRNLISKNIIPKTEQKIKEIETSNNKNVTIRDLNRILSVVNDEGSIGFSELSNVCVLNGSRFKSAINFLDKNKLITKKGSRNKVLIEKYNGTGI